ncbi:MAG: glycosyltransferase [Bacteroidia bacterium]|nr:glycosyltransferase [Bacteroidia bacterium]
MNQPTKKPVILVLLACYLPGYKSGGPVRTLANMVDQLGDDFEFRIITRDRDMLDTSPYESVSVDQWNSVGKASVFYASPGRIDFSSLVRLINETHHDVLYLNSFFNFSFTILPLLARRLGKLPNRPVVLAPRGEFSPGALGIGALKKLKKKIFIAAAKCAGIYRDITWQASSEHEANDINRVFPGSDSKIHVAPDLTPMLDEKQFGQTKREINEPLKILFLSRIAPMKNLDFALEVLETVSARAEFHIYGTIEDQSYWDRCREIIGRMPSNISVQYCGAADHEKVQEIMQAHDLFFLPTKGENFGHVIFESLAAGTPVLISDQTPWKDLDEKGVGWVKSLKSKIPFVDVIEGLSKTNAQEMLKQRHKTWTYSVQHSRNLNVVEKNRQLFQKSLNPDSFLREEN